MKRKWVKLDKVCAPPPHPKQRITFLAAFAAFQIAFIYIESMCRSLVEWLQMPVCLSRPSELPLLATPRISK